MTNLKKEIIENGIHSLGFYRLPYRSPTGKPAESIRQCN